MKNRKLFGIFNIVDILLILLVIAAGIVGGKMFLGGDSQVDTRFKFLLGAVFGGFAGLLLQGLTDHLWFDYRIVLFFWCFIGIGMAAVRVGERKGERETEER